MVKGWASGLQPLPHLVCLLRDCQDVLSANDTAGTLHMGSHLNNPRRSSIFSLQVNPWKQRS